MKIADISIRWKILFAVIVGPLTIASVLAWQRIDDIRTGAEEGLIEKSQAILLMAEAARNEMSAKLQTGIIKPLDQLEGGKILQAVPVITAINTAAANADKSGYSFRVPKNNPRNPRNQPTELERRVLQEMSDHNLTEKIVFEPDQIRYFKPVRLTADCLYCHGDPKGAKDPTGGTKEGWRAGEIHGAFEIISPLAATHAAVAKAKWSVAGVTALLLSTIMVIVGFLVKAHLLNPLQKAKSLIGRISQGDLTQSINTASSDEFGQIIRDINRMSSNLRKLVHEIADTSDTISTSSADLSTISASLSTSAGGTSERANTVAVAAEEMSSNMNSVAAAMEQASTNVGVVTTAVAGMTGTITTISTDTENAKTTTCDAVVQAQSASERVNRLGEAAKEIEKITETIAEISEQTNLLALNATIEAARAGEAGKGFAVVANEIKELAKQTAAATNEINRMVEKIQSSTVETVSEIEHVTKVIHNVNETVTGIAQAMNEQLNSTNEIAANISQASTGIQEVNVNVAQSSTVSREIAKDIAEVNQSAKVMSRNSHQLSDSSTALNQVAARLKETVHRFTI